MGRHCVALPDAMMPWDDTVQGEDMSYGDPVGGDVFSCNLLMMFLFVCQDAPPTKFCKNI